MSFFILSLKSIVKKVRESVGLQVILLHAFITYIFPLLGYTFFADEMNTSYKTYPINFWVISPLILIYGLAFIIYSRFGDHFLKKISLWNCSRTSIFDRFGNWYLRKRIFFALISFVLGLVYVFFDLTSYRYASMSISETNSPLLLVGIVLQTFIFSDFFYQMFVSSKRVIPVFGRVWLENAAYGIALLLFVDGTVTTFLTLFCVFYAFAPHYFRKLFFIDNSLCIRQKIFTFSQLFLITLVIFGLSWSYGESIKKASANFGTQEKIATNRVDTKKSNLSIEEESVDIDVEDGNSNKKIDTYFFGLISTDSKRAEKRRVHIAKKIEEIPLKFVRLVSRVKNRILRSSDTYSKNGDEAVGIKVVKKEETGGRFAGKINGFKMKLLWAKEKMNRIFSLNFFVYVCERMSAHYYSYVHAVTMDKEYLFEGEKNALIFPIRTLFYRADLIIGGVFGVKRPEISSISQLNYKTLTAEKFSDRIGTSPGLLGSFAYIFSWPAFLMFATLYIIFLILFFDYLVSLKLGQSFSIIGLFLLLKYTQDFFDSPFDILTVFDSGAIQLFVFAIMFISIKKLNSFEVITENAKISEDRNV